MKIGSINQIALDNLWCRQENSLTTALTQTSRVPFGTSDHEEAHAGVPGHINNVGNINCQAGMIKHPDLINVQNKQWKSSGSIFDCEQGCFSEDTVII